MKTQTAATHTPTPWMIKEKMSGLTIASESKAIGQIDNRYDNYVNNAAFIVRAVNNFESMLRTLKAIEGYEEATRGIKKIAQIAIAKAEGK